MTAQFNIAEINSEKKARSEIESSRSNEKGILEKVQLLKQISISSDRGSLGYPEIKIGTFDDSEEIDMIIDYYID